MIVFNDNYPCYYADKVHPDNWTIWGLKSLVDSCCLSMNLTEGKMTCRHNRLFYTSLEDLYRQHSYTKLSRIV